MVTWQSNTQDGSGEGIYGQRFSSDGSTSGSEFKVNTTTAADQITSNVTSLSNGGFVVTWQSGSDINGQLYAANGTASGNEFQVNTDTTDNQTQPSVASLADGGFVISWTADSDQDGSGEGIYAQRFNADGTKVGDEIEINSFTDGNQSTSSVTSLIDGGFLVTWNSFDQDNSSSGIYGQRFTADGLTAGEEFKINTTTNGSQANASTASLSNGDVIVTWVSANQDGSGDGIYGQRLTFDSTAFEYKIPDDTFEDVDANDTLTYTATLANDDPLPDWLNFDTETQTFRGVPKNGDVGDIDVKVTLTDSASSSVSDTFTLSVTNTNDAPVVDTEITDQSVDEDSTFSFEVPDDTFDDVDFDNDENETLTYSATLANGDPLPSWLSFNAGTKTFSGTPGNDDVAILEVKVIATDADGATASDIFELTVSNTNDDPTLANAIADQTVAEDSAFNFTVPTNTFADVDVDDAFIYTATLDDDSSLPTWLIFDADTQTFSGTPENGDVGNIDVKVTATDSGSSSISSTFTLAVTNTNDAPVLDNVLVDQTVDEDTDFSFELPSDTFSDVDAFDTLTYTATLSNGDSLDTVSWLSFDGTTFSGTPSKDDVGELEITVTATDDGLGSFTASDTFNITVSNTNDDPTITSTEITSATQDNLYSYTFAANDVDQGDTLTLAATTKPDWLTFDATTGRLWGRPTNDEVGDHDIVLTATDSTGSVVTQSFTISVANVNDTPTVTNIIDSQNISEDSALSFTVPSDTFGDIDAGDALTYSATLADNSNLPSWLSFDAGTQTFSGTPENDQVGSIDIKVTATDSAGLSVSTNFTLTTTNTNDAPTVDNEITDQTVAEDSAINFTVPANTFADVDAGDTATYTATLDDDSDSALPSWLSFDPDTQTFTGTPENGDVGDIDVKVTHTDSAGSSVSDTFTLSVTNTNDTPVVADEITDQTTDEDSAFSFEVPDSIFDDVDFDNDDNESLTYSATLADGGLLPTWLIFDTSTKTFSGTPENGDVETISLKVTATDATGASVSDIFDLTINNTNDDPTLSTAIADQTVAEDGAFNFTVPSNTFADVDVGDTFTYSATLADDNPLPTWLSFDADTQTFSGTPENGDVGEIDIKVTATDSGSSSISSTFTLAVTNTNDVSVVTDDSYTTSEERAIHGKLPLATDDDQSVFTTPFTSSSEFKINTETTSHQINSSVASFSDGSYVVVWTSDSQDGNDDGIFGQRFNADNSPAGSEFQVNSTTSNAQLAPSVSALIDGLFVVTWQSMLQDESDLGVYGQRFAADGSKSGVEFQINTETDGAQKNSSVTNLSDETFIVTWQSNGQDGEGTGVYGKIFTLEGKAVDDEFLINTTTTGNQQKPSVTALADGDFIVTWESGSSSDTDIYGQRFDVDGNTVGSEFAINTHTSDNQTQPIVTGLSDGSFLVAWVSEGQDTSDNGIYGQLYAANGDASGSEFVINTSALGDQIEPSIAALVDGGFIVAWSTDGTDDSLFDINAQRFDSDGEKIGDEISIGTGTGNLRLSDIAPLLMVAYWLHGALMVKTALVTAFMVSESPLVTTLPMKLAKRQHMAA